MPLRRMGFTCIHANIDLSGSLTETTPRRHARCLQKQSVNSSCSPWLSSSLELKPIEAGRVDVMHGAGKDRFVACKPHLAEELRVNRGRLGPCEGLSESHSTKRLGCGGFEDQIVVLHVSRVESRGRRIEKSRLISPAMDGQMADGLSF